MTEYQLRIIFVLVLCAPVAYFGVRFFISLVNNAVAGKRAPEGRKAAKGGRAPASGKTSAKGRASSGRKRPERRE
jgi:hypothetical protein